MSRKVFWFLALFAILLLGCDLLLKNYVYFHISPFQGVSVFQSKLGIDFSLDHVRNTGAAWGMLSSWQMYLLWGRCVIILALLGSLFFASFPLGRKAALSWIAAGAIGNVLDFFLYGHVVDMFHFRFWGYSYPVFNIADSMIFCGVAFLFLSQYRESRILKKSVEKSS